MRTVIVVILALTLIATAAYSANIKPKPVTLQGQMVCLWCDVVTKSMPQNSRMPHACTAAFAANDGMVYTLVPDTIGKELDALPMHEQKVEVQGFILPGSQILEAQSYMIVKKVKPVTPELGPWFNY
jgi:hypothetical protein